MTISWEKLDFVSSVPCPTMYSDVPVRKKLCCLLPDKNGSIYGSFGLLFGGIGVKVVLRFLYSAYDDRYSMLNRDGRRI